MSRPNPTAVHRVWEALQERERARAYFSRLSVEGGRYPSPESVFYSTRDSRSERERNRYSDVLAYDRTAVRVEGRYLNASVVLDNIGNWWVAAQAPLPNTFHDFFRGIFMRSASQSRVLPRRESGVKDRRAILVQLTNWVERGMQKADPYMPRSTKVEDDRVFTAGRDTIRLHMDSQDERLDLGGRHSAMTLTASEGNMSLDHYHFTLWPDHGVPEGKAVGALRNLVKEVWERREELGADCEVWVHCSAGVGRTGAFIALSSINMGGTAKGENTESPLGPLPPQLRDDTIAERVDGIRECRNILVQTPEQLYLVYSMSAEWTATEGKTVPRDKAGWAAEILHTQVENGTIGGKQLR